MKLKSLATLCAAFLCLVFALGCSKESTKTAAASKAAATNAPGEVPKPMLRDFDAYFPRFPQELGHTWTYNIDIPSNMVPLRHTWVHSSKVPNNGPSELFGSLTPKKNSDGRIRLVLRAEGVTRELSEIYASATIVAVDRDDLGLFDRVRRLYWAISPIQWRDGNYVVTQHLKYQVSGGEAETYSVQKLFFQGKPGFELAVKGENEKVVFVGAVKVDGHDCLHFRRVVGTEVKVPAGIAADPAFRAMTSPFVENMWFERNVGLMRLVQTVNPDGPGARVTMVWNLERQ